MSRPPRSRKSKNEPSGVKPLHAPYVPAATKFTGKVSTWPFFTVTRIKAESLRQSVSTMYPET